MSTLRDLRLNTLATALLATGLSACGGVGQDEGEASDFSQTLRGVVIDGYLARATVFIDSNNNGTRDPWEAYAFTDNEGYYSYNPKTGTDYCAATATDSEKVFCLVSSRPLANQVVRIDGGYDILTGEPFKGQMSRRLSSTVDEQQSNVISPLTSLFTDFNEDNRRQSLLDSLAISNNDLDIDYYNVNDNGSVNTLLMNKALKVHKTVSILADRLTDTYEEIGEQSGMPNDLSNLVYSNLATTLAESHSPFNDVIQSDANLTSILRNTEFQVSELYSRRDLNLPNTIATSHVNRTNDNVRAVAQVIDRLLSQMTDSTDDLPGRVSAIEVLSIKVTQENNGVDASIESAANFFLDANNTSLINRLTQSLSQETADIGSLVPNDFSGDDFDSEEEITRSATLPEGTVAFTNLPGMQLRISDLDLGFGPNNLDDAEVEVYFSGNSSDIDGTMKACVKFIDDAHSDGTLGELSTRGELVSGYWSLLGKTNNQSSYNVLLTLNFLGSTYQAIMKSKGSAQINGKNMQVIRFDYDGDLTDWHSELGLQTQTGLPVNNKDCEARLPSRIGI